MTNGNIEQLMVDTVLENPKGFSIGNRKFYIYAPTLGKTLLFSRLFVKLKVNINMIKSLPVIEIMGLLKDKQQRGLILKAIVLNTFDRREDILNEDKCRVRAEYFDKHCNDEEITQLFIIVTSLDNTDDIVRHLGLDKQRKEINKICALKNKNNNSLTFGGTSLYGTILDMAANRYGWSLEYILWGISYTNLRLMLADAINTMYISDDERKKLGASIGQERVDMDDPKNWDKIKSMKWD